MHARVEELGVHFSAAVRPEDVVVHTPLARADAILVLGNRMRGSAMVLARKAAALYRKGLSNRIIVSGGVLNEEGRKEADHIRTCLRAIGIPAQAITVESRSTNTKENIVLSKRVAQHVKSFPKRPTIIVIGQRFASRRILMTMAAQWPEATAMLAPVCMMGKPLHKWHDHPWAMRTVLREIEKLPEYRAKGDVAHVNIERHNRALNIYKARHNHPRPVRA